MKTNRDSQTTPRRSHRSWPLALLTVIALGSPLGATEPTEAPKDHALFVGGDMCIEVGGARREVIAATKNEVYVLVDGKRVAMALDKVGDVKIERSLKLSDLVARIDELKGTPTKLKAGGERPQWLEQRFLMSSIQDQAAADYARAFNTQQTAANQLGQSASPMDTSGSSAAAAQRSYNAASASVDRAATVSSSVKEIVPSEKGAPDALEISGAFSAPKATSEAFVLLVTGFRENEKADVQYRMHLEPLKGLGPKPQRVSFVQGGFPARFVLESYSLHLFADGREVATNLSDKRVDLTADDALRYLTLCYITKHAKETRDAEPLRIAFPGDFKQQSRPAWLEKPVYLTVASDGIVRKASADQAGAALDPYLDSVVAKFRFAPALKEGKPVESVVAFSLGEYLR